MSEEEQDQSVLLLALGNTQRQQDGFGPVLLNYLKEHFQFPVGLVVLSAGMNPLSYYPLIAACRWLILVDAVIGGRDAKPEAPGANNEAPVVLLQDPFTPKQVNAEKISSHGLSADSLLTLLDAIGQIPPRVTLLGLDISTSDLNHKESQFSSALLQQVAEKLDNLLSQEGMKMSRIDMLQCL